ncbi:MAG: FlgD immunoglobulin-like domain containing protein [Calditrichota bacterium]
MEASGGQYSFRQDWYATTMNGPILDVNKAGAIERQLCQNTQTGNIEGTFGVFHIGTAKLVTKDASGTILTEGTTHNITSLEKLEINESLELPAEMASIEIVVYDYTGKEVGSINSVTSEQLTSVEAKTETLPENLTLLQNYPNPFNPTTTIQFDLNRSKYVQILIYNTNGQLVRLLANNNFSAGKHKILWDGKNRNNFKVPSGIYYCTLKAENYFKTIKLVLLK